MKAAKAEQPKELKSYEIACKAADDKKAWDIVTLDMSDSSLMADYFVICSARNNRQSQSIADNIEEQMEKNGYDVRHVEGYREGKWILIDAGEVIAHVFVEQDRQYYDLETYGATHRALPTKVNKMTTLQENSIVTLEVLRQSDMGVFLNGGTGNTNDDILLHKNQQTGDVKVGDKVTVFLYHDPSGRLTASMRLPKIKVGQIGYAPVINTTRFGAFVDVGTERGIFMPFAEMKGRPKEGEYVWVKLYEDKSHRLAVSMEVEDEMRRASRAATDAKVGDWVEGAVYNMTDQGAYLMTRERWIAFLHRSEFNGPILIGQMIKGRITYLREDGRINISLRQTKENAINPDAERILDFLKQRKGKMPYGDKTAPAVIKAKFGLSKAAFKRALGHLMKEKKIHQDQGWTYLDI